MSERQVWPPAPDHPPVEPDARARQGRLRRAGLALVVTGSVVGLIALGLEARLLWGFYQDALALPRGTPIRPMGLTLGLAVVALGAFLLGCPLAGLGLIFGARSRSRRVVAWGIAALCLCLAPLPASSAVFQYIADARGLPLEP